MQYKLLYINSYTLISSSFSLKVGRAECDQSQMDAM